MNKPASFFLTLTVLGTLCLVLSTSVNAQDLTAAKAYQDYQYQTSNYLNSEAEYEDAKTFYKKNPTLQLREEARKKTLSFLKNRDQLLIVYLTALRTQITELTGFTADEEAAIYSNLDPEIAWYQSHVNSYQDGDELSLLFDKSDESKNRYEELTRNVVYNAIFDLGLSEEIGLRVDHENIYIDLKKFIDEQVAAQKLSIDPFNRWLNDTDTVLAILSKNEADAKSKIPTFYSKKSRLNSTYNKNIQVIISSVSPLKQLNNYLSEMLTYIKSQPL